ncbi:protein phosphatase 1 regulatory subunit 26 isoform X2 [Astyanax mexicanus]|uniref:protein phosphatase 1 regulatory subunit 26 isoform X2 n=1 Tax=Astyanax mexicanus TaxID=7994 RepID=UPI0020CACFB6|nr:protein phosphatase 1 regulatory subunit 26 isoform X2 [Astyanax mexicanus]
MFLKTVPPVVAVHSEWRSGKSFSLPLCFNDSASDSDFASASGTPIPHKVQMIIDSLRSTQSSDMSDNVQASAGTQSTLDLARHASNKSKPRQSEGSSRSRRMTTDSPKLHAAGLLSSEGSDSDDSVDRGIEEAIQQYLKDKGDPQPKEEPPLSPLQAPKVSQIRESVVPEPPKQLTHSNSNKVLTASNHDQKGTKGVQNVCILKKKKKKKPSKENPNRKMDAAKALLTKAQPLSGVRKASSSCVPGVDRTPPPLHIKEEESLDSSSDDGIEEAIQRFQQEQKERYEGSSHLKEELDSSSDDGIEEAIRHFQQEKQKQDTHKLHPKQSPVMGTQHSKLPVLPTDRPDLLPFKILPKKKSSSSKKKGAAAEREGKCASPKLLASVGHSLSMSPVHSLMVRGDPICTAKAEEPVADQQIHSTLTVNTTAELMCAEAILDISKTVMPAAFEPNMSLAKTSVVEVPPPFPSGPPLQTDEKSDESSVDSEDGIEQEIRKFLELKAKMHDQPQSAAAAPVACPEGPSAPKQKKKAEDDQSKALRLSLSRKRKLKEEDNRSVKRQPDNGIFKEEPQPMPVTQSDGSTDMVSHMCSPVPSKHTKPKQISPLHGHPEGSVTKDKGSSSGSRIFPHAQRPLPGSEQNYSSDKSSSLDSDEDLDAAIKDLLKTKKRVKKKVRDMKLKARKGLAETPDKKHKLFPEQKSTLAPKPTKPCTLKSSKEQRHDLKSVKPKGLKPPHQSGKTVKAPTHDTETDCNKDARNKTLADLHPCVPVDEDSSSVDSDDSIEQEIRRFLAEKAKVSTVQVASVKEEDAGGLGEAGSSISGIREREVCADELKVEESAFSGAFLEKGERPQEVPVTPASVLRLPNTTSVTGERPAQRPTTFCTPGDNWRTDGQLARTSDERRNGSFDVGNDRASFSEGTSSDPFTVNLTSPRDTQCQVKHQNLFLMKPENCSMTDIREPTSVDFRDKPSGLQNRNRIPLKEVISAVCPSPAVKPPISSPSESPVVSRGDRLPLLTPESRTDSFYLHSRIKRQHWDQPPRLTPSVPHPYPPNLTPNSRHLSPHLPTNPSHLSCASLPPALSQPPRITASVVRLRRDQAAVIPLSPHKTNHLQLRNRQEERERERTNEGREEEEEEDEKCIDETDLESGEERRSAEQQRIDKRQQQQQRSSQVFSTSIDPGEMLSPYIALDTDQRREKFKHIRQLQDQRAKKAVKRKLQFVFSSPR